MFLFHFLLLIFITNSFFLLRKVAKVKLPLYLTKYHVMKTKHSLSKHHTVKHWGAEVQLHAFLNSALDRGEWSDSRPGCFIPGGKSPRYPLDRTVWTRRQWESNTGRQARSLCWL